MTTMDEKVAAAVRPLLVALLREITDTAQFAPDASHGLLNAYVPVTMVERGWGRRMKRRSSSAPWSTVLRLVRRRRKRCRPDTGRWLPAPDCQDQSTVDHACMAAVRAEDPAAATFQRDCALSHLWLIRLSERGLP
jgi:hypothetical protein